MKLKLLNLVFLLLVSHLRLNQLVNDTAEGWLKHFCHNTLPATTYTSSKGTLHKDSSYILHQLKYICNYQIKIKYCFNIFQIKCGRKLHAVLKNFLNFFDKTKKNFKHSLSCFLKCYKIFPIINLFQNNLITIWSQGRKVCKKVLML